MSPVCLHKSYSAAYPYKYCQCRTFELSASENSRPVKAARSQGFTSFLACPASTGNTVERRIRCSWYNSPNRAQARGLSIAVCRLMFGVLKSPESGTELLHRQLGYSPACAVAQVVEIVSYLRENYEEI
jgi:hypothetical protein